MQRDQALRGNGIISEVTHASESRFIMPISAVAMATVGWGNSKRQYTSILWDSPYQLQCKDRAILRSCTFNMPEWKEPVTTETFTCFHPLMYTDGNWPWVSVKFSLSFVSMGEMLTITLDVSSFCWWASLWKLKVGKGKMLLGLAATCSQGSDAQLVQELIRMLAKLDLCLIKASGQRPRELVL